MSALQVSVAYALPQQQFDVAIELAEGASVADALAAVADREPFNSLDLQDCAVGVFNQVVNDRSRLLRPGDRVEIYRPLILDPMAARRERADAQKNAQKKSRQKGR